MGEPPANGIRIRLFAGLREQAGWAEQQWPLNAASEPPLTPQQLWEALQLPGPLSSVRIAINQQFSRADAPLNPGDELAFLPPISGG
ncbi:MAG: hypothetical protein RLZZ186_369 [Cyanobacteriota bacterium]|jgi:molybdopterin synthase sulfur carrier subunit